MTCPKDTLRINVVVELGKAWRKSNSVEVRICIHAVDEEVQLKTQPQHTTPRSAAARSSHSPRYRPAVFLRHLRPTVPSIPQRKFRRAFQNWCTIACLEISLSRAVYERFVKWVLEERNVNIALITPRHFCTITIKYL